MSATGTVSRLPELLWPNKADFALVDPRRLAVGRVMHLEHQIGSGRNQLGRTMVLIEILAMDTGHVSQ
jgi:hypothetical protein